MPTINNILIQSPFLYLQAAGSDGSDGSSEGIHLRWDFRKELKAKHLAKGNLAFQGYPTNIAFNRPKDFIHIYRANYTPTYLDVNFNVLPSQIIDSGQERIWFYNVIGYGNKVRRVKVNFKDVAQYDQLKVNSTSDIRKLLFEYNAILELSVEGELFFHAEIGEFSYAGPEHGLEVESISLKDSGNPDDTYISCRKTFNKIPTGAPFVECENISYLKMRITDAILFNIRLELYEDSLIHLEERKLWQSIGSFSLTDDKLTALTRLEDPGRFTIHKKWPKFNETDLASGEFTVNAQNYVERWEMPDGLEFGVKKYLHLSKTDPEANEIQADEEGESNTELSYLSLLNFASVDYHVARMLGLGHIDDTPQGNSQKYLYLAEYVTEAYINPDFPASLRTHHYMSLPTSKLDFRLPPAPKLKPVQYGLTYGNGTETPFLLSDENGYIPSENGAFDYVRYIGIHKEKFAYQNEMEPFFHSRELFCVCPNSHAVLFGLEYKEHSEPNYRRPEILNDNFFKDPSGLPEVVPIPESDENKAIYVHEETTEGIHAYKLYSINWFSRVSAQSNEVVTDFTLFPTRNSLKPPSNLAVQLIQKESPLLFTSGQEQTMLENLANPDKTLVRTTFDWTDVQNVEYQFARKLEFFYRESVPLSVQGKIIAVINKPNNEVEIQTGPIVITSSTPNTTVQPHISGIHTSRFSGSQIVIDGEPFEVISVVTSGNNPKLRLKKNRTDAVQESSDEQGLFTITDSYPDVPNNKPFLVYENLSQTDSWDFKLNKEVDIIQFNPPYQESRIGDDGQVTVLNIGGIFKPASIVELEDVYGPNDPAVTADANNSPFAGDPIPGSHTGIFTLTFNGYNLPPHTDPDVEWHKGIIRISEDISNFPPVVSPSYRPPEMKRLSVVRVESLAPLTLVIIDASFDPSSSNSNPKEEYMPIPTGVGIDVNYHPGYKFYLEEDTTGGNQFDEGSILPVTGGLKKTTFLCARSKDHTHAPVLFSEMTPPATVLAIELQEPVPPKIPTGPAYATRPNFYGKSNYSFDVEVNTTGGRQPYSLVFFRGEFRKILDRLYKKDTIAQIITNLNNLPPNDAAFFTSRWNDLVNVNFDPATNEFPVYVPDGYHFPLPDNNMYRISNVNPTIENKPFSTNLDFGDSFTQTLYIDGDGTPVTQVYSFEDTVAEALQVTFFPLTEQPILYRYIKAGQQTSSEKPKIRDNGGDLIFPPTGVPIDFNTFDPFPMAVKFNVAGKTNIRFTDYTLDGAADSFYFYFGAELSSRMEMSGASPIAGPIKLVNTVPAEKPSIAKINAKSANPHTGQKTAVELSVNPYIDSELIARYELFRATNSADSKSIRFMKKVGEFDLETTLTDEFEDLDFPPYGEPLFYRVVALRKIQNERDETELVPSKPSKLILTNVVDNSNPPAPILGYVSDPAVAIVPITLHNISLTWNKTVHNGKYHIYKMNSQANWVLIHTVVSNSNEVEVALIDTNVGSGSFIKEDATGNVLYSRYKVVAENASGLLSLDEKVLTL